MLLTRNLRSRKVKVLITTFCILVFSQCKKDHLTEGLQIQSGLSGAMPDGIKLATTGVTSSSYYLINSLPSGYVKDGSKDYTSYIQAAVNKYSNIVFPGFPLLVNDAGILIGSNKIITFEAGAELRLKASDKTGYCILKIYNASNVQLYNPVIVGDRNSHIGTSGEWGMGLGIYGSTDITVYNSRVTNCWGDGIYLGQVDGRINCKNIILNGSYLRNNRRDGISIIGVDGLLIDNMYSGYNSGTAPGTGINFEANNPTSELKNVRLNNPTTEFNGERGIQVTGHHMLNSTSNKYLDIAIVNHIDKSSPYSAFKFSVKNIDGTSAKMYGEINLVNPSWQKTTNNRPLHILTDQTGLKIKVSSPEIITTGGSLLSWTDTYNTLIKAANIVDVTKDIDPLFSTTSSTTSVTSSTGTLIFAVNAGGSTFTASNGITYGADKNYSSGSIYKTTNAINNTTDDILYQSERFGNFSYSIPVVSGTYEITFKVAEVYKKTVGARQFDIIAEGSSIVSNLDIYSVAGYCTKYDLVKTISVSDGNLNLQFRTDIDNAKISAFHIIKK